MAAVVLDRQSVVPLYFQIQQQFAKDVPFFPLFYVPFVNAVSSKVHGFSENPLGYFNIQGVTKSG